MSQERAFLQTSVEEPDEDAHDSFTPIGWTTPGPRFVSPSLLCLALLTLPLPWLEVSCGGHAYSQTGLQMMTNTQSDLNLPATESRQARRPVRQSGTVIWTTAALLGVILGLAKHNFTWDVVQACCAALAALLLPAVILLVLVEEALSSVTWQPWPIVACVACAGAAVASVVTLVRERSKPRHVPPRRFPDEFD
jgi:hypothetical protein